MSDFSDFAGFVQINDPLAITPDWRLTTNVPGTGANHTITVWSDGRQRIGTCSECGGDVIGHRGPWWSVMPPPPDHCADCGAVRADDVIEMRRIGKRKRK